MSRYQLPNESPEYRKRRTELLEAEIALKNQRERVAELRRRLPTDTKAAAYVLREDPSPPWPTSLTSRCVRGLASED